MQSAPVATATASPEPECTTVPISSALLRSPSAASGCTGSTDLSDATDSPVTTASSQDRSVALSSRRSAGTTAPRLSRTTSPTTRSATGTSLALPSRTTTTVCETWSCSELAWRSARHSLPNPSPTLASRITKMMDASARSPVTNDKTAATTRSSRIGLFTCRHSTITHVTLRDGSTLGPLAASREAASDELNPCGPDDRSPKTWSGACAAACDRVSAAGTDC